jgi:hypothetical protein
MRTILVAVLAAASAASAQPAPDPAPPTDDALLETETIEITDKAPLASAAVPPSTIDREQLRTLPGARGDAMEAVRNLPGVAFATSGQGGTGDLAIRGTSGSDSWFLIDGIAVPATMQLGGLTAIVPAEMIHSVDLHAGGFDVAWGRATGGVVEMTTRAGDATHWRAVGDVSFVHASASVEGPLVKDRATIVAGVRRSFLDMVLPAFIDDDDGLAFTRPPVYSDALLRIDVAPAPRHQLTLLALYSDDRVEVELDEGDDRDPGFTGFASTERFWRGAATWRYDGRRLDARAIASVGTDDESLSTGPLFGFALTALAATGRLDLRFEATPRIVLRAGLDGATTRYDIVGRAPVGGGGEGQRDPNLSLDPSFEADFELSKTATAVYGAADLRVHDAVSVTPGVRVERYGADDVVIEPRVAAELSLGAWTARATLGRFSRTQDQLELAADQLRAERATQASMGLEHKLRGGVRAGATLFASWLDRLAVFEPMRSTDDDPLAGYANAGTGTVRGVEVRAEVRRENLFGWLAYTFSQSRRVDVPGMAERLFDQDQPHNLVAAGSYRLGRWRFGARFRLASGIPETPIVGSVYVSDHDVYRPSYGTTNSVRLPGTHQLDLRIDRELVRAPVKLTGYLDIANVYANPRVSGYAYDFDYRNRTEVTELPLTPSIGLRGEL